MLSQGNSPYDQCGEDAQSPTGMANTRIDDYHSCHLKDPPYISPNLDSPSPRPDQLGHSLGSQGYSFDQYNENDALSPTGSEVWHAFAGLNLSRQQIKEHNSKVGWQQWITLKGIVYDTTSFKQHFIAYNKKKAAEMASQQASDCSAAETAQHAQKSSNDSLLDRYSSSRISDIIDLLHGNNCDQQKSDKNSGAEDLREDEDADEDVEDDDDSFSSEGSSFDTEFLWKYNVITALQKTGLSMSEIESEIRPFKIGTLQNPALPRWKYWDSIRTDILAVCDDITGKDGTEIGKYEQEYLTLLQRWLRKYSDIDPVDKATSGDGNISVFFFTEDPDSLRDWMKTLHPLDTELPDSGAWVSSELLLSPLGDTHDVFSAALRSHNSSVDPFSHDIQGKVAWAELPQDVIKNDQMTPNQQLVYERRLKHGSRVHDPKLMKKRRERLGRYFEKYHYFEEKMGQYLRWAAVMEQNQRDLEDLCYTHL